MIWNTFSKFSWKWVRRKLGDLLLFKVHNGPSLQSYPHLMTFLLAWSFYWQILASWVPFFKIAKHMFLKITPKLWRPLWSFDGDVIHNLDFHNETYHVLWYETKPELYPIPWEYTSAQIHLVLVITGMRWFEKRLQKTKSLKYGGSQSNYSYQRPVHISIICIIIYIYI